MVGLYIAQSFVSMPMSLIVTRHKSQLQPYSLTIIRSGLRSLGPCQILACSGSSKNFVPCEKKHERLSSRYTNLPIATATTPWDQHKQTMAPVYILSETSAGYALFKSSDKKLLKRTDIADKTRTAEDACTLYVPA